MSSNAETELGRRRLLELILGGFMVVQPLLDIITASEVSAGSSLSVGIVVRMLFLAFSLVYVVFFSRFERKRAVMVYVLLLAVFLLCFAARIFSVGGLSLLLRNAKELVKTMFVPFTAAFLYALYREYGLTVSRRSVTVSCGIYAFVILAAYLTKTSNISYRSGYGYNGWFYAANEINSIIAIAAPVTIYSCLRMLYHAEKKTAWKVVFALAGLASVVFAANYIGTKIVFLAVLTYSAAASVWCIVFCFRKPSRRSVTVAAVAVLIVVFTLVLYPKSPLCGYMDNIYSDYVQQQSDDLVTDKMERYKDSAEVTAELKTMNTATENTWLRQLIAENAFVQKIDSVLSRRLFTASPAVQTYIDGGLMTKLFGVGYANAPNGARNIEYMIELDGLGILIRLGIVGFLLCFVPFFVFILYAVVRFFRHPLKRLASLRFCSDLFASLLSFAIAVIAGHVLVAPAVGIFMLAVNSGLFAECDQLRGEDCTAPAVMEL